MESRSRRRISVDKEDGMQFGNFKYRFKQKPLSMWESDIVCINEIEMYTCDNVPVTKLVLNTKDTEELYGHFIDLIRDRDSFYESLQINNNKDISRLYGWFDFVSGQYKIQVEKEQFFNKENKSIIVIAMDDEDFQEFIFLFYFHFLIALVG